MVDTALALESLSEAKNDRQRCALLGLDSRWRGTLWRLRNGHAVSLAAENEVRRRLGLSPLPPQAIPVPPCPDCGGVHHARCYGRVGETVVLGADERVVRRRMSAPGKPRKAYWRPCLPAELAAGVREYGIDLAALVRVAIAEREKA